MAETATREASLGQQIGGRLRDLRKARGLTLRQLATQAGISEALLSRIERGQVATPVANLASLADCLGVGLAALLEGPAASPGGRPYSLTRAGESGGPAMTVGGYRYRPICPGLSAPLSALMVSYAPGEPDGWLTHAGTELIYLVSGRLRFRLGEETIDLESGDCLIFDSALPHRAWSLEATAAETLMVLDRQTPAHGLAEAPPT